MLHKGGTHMLSRLWRKHRFVRITVIVLACCLAVMLLLRPRGVRTYLVYGVDQYGSLDEEGRSDAMMLVRLDAGRREVAVVSLARDMLVDNGRGGRTKINTVIRKDSGDGGGGALCEAIERNFGVSVDGWFRINFSSLVSLVDAAGGVSVELTAEEAAYIDKNAGRYPQYPLSEGTCLLCGGQALSFVRCRHLDNDLGRGQRQSRFAQAVVRKLRGMSPLRILSLYRGMDYAWRSSLGAAEQGSLVWRALWARRHRVLRLALPFDGTWRYGSASGTSGILPDLEENRRQLRAALGIDD